MDLKGSRYPQECERLCSTFWLNAPARGRPQPRQQGRLALCLQRTAAAPGSLRLLHAWIATALVLGASIADPSRQEPFDAGRPSVPGWVKGPFQAPRVIWVIRLTSPHLR